MSTTFPGSPRLVRGGLVVMDPAGRAVQRVIALQYNPETLSRSLQIQGVGGEAGERSEALRLKGPAVETLRFEAEIDATDRIERPDQSPLTVRHGIHPDLALLESLVSPPAAALAEGRRASAQGNLEILPVEAPLLLLVWSSERVVPVRITEFAITEEAFDVTLNPLRAKVSLALRILSIDDLPPDSRAASLFVAHLQRKERLAGLARPGNLQALGVAGLP
jgi:hypothetical protein